MVTKISIRTKERFFGILNKFSWEDILQDYLFKLVVAKKIVGSLELYVY